MQNILVGIDFSERSAQLVEQAASLGLAFGSTIRLLHVAPPDPSFASSKGWPQEVRDELAKELKTEHHELQEMADSLQTRGLEAKAMLARGPIPETLLEFAEQTHTDLIIVGTSHHGAFFKLLPHSAIKGILARPPCPVLIVPDREAWDRSANS